MESKREEGVSDEELILHVRQGDRYALKQLFYRHYDALCRYSYSIGHQRELARDAVQDLFFRLWEDRERLNITHSVKAWLFRSTHNRTIDLLRKDRPWVLHDALDESLPEENDRSEPADMGLVQRIWEIVEEMPDQRRQIFLLYRKEGLSYKEIAHLMSITRKTVENHLSKALQDIRDQLVRENRL
ncbi:MAG: RNA polymerase sigma-70 factor [Balneolaceae bacterium]